MPAIATSMIAATGSAVRAAAQPQDQSQVPAEDSPFAILLAALSAQSAPMGEGADAEASSDAAVPGSPQSDQAGQIGKPIAAASDKSNADDQMARAVLAALLNTTAAPPPFSPPVPEPEANVSTPATALADNDKAKPANTGAVAPPDASTQIDPAAPPGAPSSAGAPINPAGPVPSDEPATPPVSGDKVPSDNHIADAATADGSTDPVIFTAAKGPAAPLPVSGGKTGPGPKISDASNTDADSANKAQAEKKSAASDPSETNAAPAMIAAAVAGPTTTGQASADQTASTVAAVDAVQSPAIRSTPSIDTKPAKGMAGTEPVAITPSDSDDADEPADAGPENTSPIPVTLAAFAKAATAPVKPAGASAKPVANAQAATDAPLSDSQDKPQIPSAAHANPSAHAAAPKTDTAAPSNDNANPVQADSTATPVPAAVATHAAPPPSQPVAIMDPSSIVAPHAASASSSGANPSASLEIISAAADPVPDLNGFAVNIAARSLSGAKQFEIRLDPPELGRVDVRLSIDAAGKAVAHMATDQPQTLDLLRKDAPALTQALRDAGLDVSQNGLNFSLRGQDRQSGDNQSGGRKSSLSARLAIQAVQAPAALAYAGAASNARLDIHV